MNRFVHVSISSFWGSHDTIVVKPASAIFSNFCSMDHSLPFSPSLIIAH
ncbi:hypothetical protein [Cohnella silvisoli]|uniref:Uncharacterized protein n=1 Tax=Cohnella silvisoli TaxID=2873699 RepID=A0ABV1L314_9BACL|nr:hypothetical protein [Cohnella silvisoli]MCD9025408.1 hypothetical protein [Cohnella silvisoli]